MRGIIYHFVIVNFIILTFAIVVEQSRFVPRPEKVHLGHGAYPRRWGTWCSEDYDCGLGFCRGYTCQCYPGYITWYYMETCAYEQRKKLTAFLLSFFVGIFGVEWFYLSRGNPGYIIAGIIKLIISSGCCIGWPLVRMATVKTSRKYVVMGNVINAGLTLISVLWWLTDWIRILANAFHDGNGAPLQPWGYDYDSYRIPYRY
jgi:TM2 domain-containing membrane protein YozV